MKMNTIFCQDTTDMIKDNIKDFDVDKMSWLSYKTKELSDFVG